MKSIFASLLVATLALGNSLAAKPPNIIVIMADDMGYADADSLYEINLRKPLQKW